MLFCHKSASTSGVISAAYADGITTGVGVSYSQYFKTVGYGSGTIAVEGGTVSNIPG